MDLASAGVSFSSAATAGIEGSMGASNNASASVVSLVFIVNDSLGSLASLHFLKVGQLECLVVQLLGAAVETHGRQRAFSAGGDPVRFQPFGRFRADVEGRAAVRVLLHLVEIVGGKRCATGIGVDEGHGGAVINGQRPELLHRHLG